MFEGIRHTIHEAVQKHQGVSLEEHFRRHEEAESDYIAAMEEGSFLNMAAAMVRLAEVQTEKINKRDIQESIKRGVL